MSLESEVIPRARAAPASAVSWSAILAGAATTVAASLVLTLGAAGAGITLLYPGLPSKGALAVFTPEVGGWAMAVQAISAALGGYIAGRLRISWIGVHGDETHFRDTAHGFLAWAVAAIAWVVLAAMVLVPYGEQLAGAAAAAGATPTPAEAQRATNIAAQASLFLAIGMLLSAFVAAVAGRLGGMQHEAALERS